MPIWATEPVDQIVTIGTFPAPTYSIPEPTQCDGLTLISSVSVDHFGTLPSFVSYTETGGNLDFSFPTLNELP